MRFHFPAAVFVSVLLTCSSAAKDRTLVVAYAPNWDDNAALAKRIDYPKITHLNIAFENPVDDEGALSFNSGDALLLEAAKAQGVKVLVSIGGGAAPNDPVLSARYAKLLGAERRASFAAILRAYVYEHHFDGLDVDIEGPMITPDFGPFIVELGERFKNSGKLLTAALSEGYGGDRVSTESLQYFDFVNIMAYDGAGPWDPDAPGQHSSLEYAKSNVGYWLGRGLPKSKAVLGVPFYGYGFGEAFRKGTYNYSEILAKYPRAYEDDQVGSTLWHNGAPTLRAKARWVHDQDLAGVMIWSIDADEEGPQSLLDALVTGLGY